LTLPWIPWALVSVDDEMLSWRATLAEINPFRLVKLLKLSRNVQRWGFELLTNIMFYALIFSHTVKKLLTIYKFYCTFKILYNAL
jgi:hypothetical protein